VITLKGPEEVKKTIKEMVDKLVAEYKPDKIILFGSYAYGVPDNDSDIDFLIIKKTGERMIDRWVNVQLLLADPGRLISLETLVMTPDEIEQRLSIGDHFVEEIINKGEMLYAS